MLVQLKKFLDKLTKITWLTVSKSLHKSVQLEGVLLLLHCFEEIRPRRKKEEKKIKA